MFKKLRKVFSVFWLLAAITGIVVFNLYVPTEVVPLGIKVLLSIIMGIGGISVVLATYKN